MTRTTSATELAADQLRRRFDPDGFDFSSTADLGELEQVIGQDRAVKALTFGLDIPSPGYHSYALGPVGTGKSTVVNRLLKRQAKQRPVPDDWCYVNNFDDPERPRALRLPAGRGCELRDAMDSLVDELEVEIPSAFEAEEYQKEVTEKQTAMQKRQKELVEALNERAENKGFKLIQTPKGLAIVPARDGEVLPKDEIAELEDDERKRLEGIYHDLQEEVHEVVRKIQRMQKAVKEELRNLDRQVVQFAVEHLMQEIEDEFDDHPKVLEFMHEVRGDVLEQAERFKKMKSGEKQKRGLPELLSGGGKEGTDFENYRVNLIVDNCRTEGAPVIRERNPTEQNLVGRIEYEARLGALVTNFRMLRPGALHRANGGFLLVEARDLLLRPFSWPTFKRALKNGRIEIESMVEEFRVTTTRTLEPEPIPLDVKVVITGDPALYYLLHQLDDEFRELFKVKADFAVDTDLEEETPTLYAQFVGRVCREEELPHFDPGAVARVIEHAGRRAGDQGKLATTFADLVDLIRESCYWAGAEEASLVSAGHVQRAIDEKIHRANQPEERARELISEGTHLIDTEGSEIGQINGLSVTKLGDYAFGRPSRITARTHVGTSGVVHIDRETELGGKIHNKGALILAGYLGGHFANDVPLALSASLTFEQSYGPIDGDSASSAELYALLSSLSGLPLRQDVAVTGSVNQMGRIQAIGGVNEKIEGFFDVCSGAGLTGTQGVLIPEANARHLMLRRDVVDAVRDGRFHVWTATHVDQAISLLTGRVAGERGDDGAFPEGTVYRTVETRLEELARKSRAYSKGDGDKSKSG